VADTLRVDFYLLPTADGNGRLKFACRLAEKAYKLDNRVHLQALDAREAAAVDELLWTFRQGSFVPHEILGQPVSGAEGTISPVTIGCADHHPGSGDVLIDLAGRGGGPGTAFTRIAEIVDGSEESRAAARVRFRAYQQQGIEPVTHTIEAT
jgi:DNA polymerase-3 subunit chi